MALVFIRGCDPIWWVPNLVAQPLDDTYYISFLDNTFPYLPSLVYRDNQGITPWSQPIQFLANGTLPTNIFFNPNQVYRVEVRAGNTQNFQLIYVINDYDPSGNGGIAPIISTISYQGNQLSNGQFSSVNFSIQPVVNASEPTLSITVAGTYPVAPGWNLILTGGGSPTATVTQKIYSGNQTTVTDPVPPYSLRIDLNGWTTAILQQRLSGNGALWTDKYVAASMLARSEDGFNHVILMQYQPSDSGTSVTINDSANLSTGNFAVVQGSKAVVTSTNTDLSSEAYVNFNLILPGTGIVDVGDIQLSGQNTDIGQNFTVQPEETIERQTDHLFHYYADQLVQRPKANLLTGWNFALNPYQFNSKTITDVQVGGVASKFGYCADQTIIFSQDVAGNIQTGQTIRDFNGGFEITPHDDVGVGATQFAMIQYIDPKTVLPYWNYVLSSLANVRIFTSHGTKVRMKARLISRVDLPAALSAVYPISSWPVGGDPVFAAGWFEIKPVNDPAYVLENSYTGLNGIPYNGSPYPSIGFTFDELPSGSSLTTMTLAIVYYTLDPMVTTAGHKDSIVFDKVSLVPNNFPIEAPPQTFDECLRQCQFYYEKSYELSTMPGTVTPIGQILSIAPVATNGADYFLYRSKFELIYKQIKRVPPVVNFYAPGYAPVGNVQLGMASGTTYPSPDSGAVVNPTVKPAGAIVSDWDPINTTSSILMIPHDPGVVLTFLAAFPGPNPPISFTGDLLYQYTADARMGV